MHTLCTTYTQQTHIPAHMTHVCLHVAHLLYAMNILHIFKPCLLLSSPKQTCFYFIFLILYCSLDAPRYQSKCPVYHAIKLPVIVLCCVVRCVQGPEQSAADVGLGDGGGHAGPQEPPALCTGPRGQLVRAVPQLPAGEAAGALPHTHLQTHTGQIRTGNKYNTTNAKCVAK